MYCTVRVLCFLCVIVLPNALTEKDFLNEWAVEIRGGRQAAEIVARDHGYRIVREINVLPDHYLISHKDLPERTKRAVNHLQTRLSLDDRIIWAEQQHSKIREKRDFFDDDEPYYRIDTAPDLQQREMDEPDNSNKESFMDKKEATLFNDPRWDRQWYLSKRSYLWSHDTKRDASWVSEMQRYTGKGVVCSIIDDGVEPHHPDLAANFDPFASTDLNDNDPDPTPRVEPTSFNKHGTRCAGEIAMVANNNFCGVGVAYNAKIGGIRLLDGTVTDALEASALAFNHTHISIYSSSWGPTDKGAVVEGPGTMSTKAIYKGIHEGRGGKGVLYVWASGNGGKSGDSCGCDGYASSIYTISVSSASRSLESPWYVEKCASTLTTAYSSGKFGEPMIVSSDLRGECTDSHSGTSAAAPLAAGVLALVLEANPELTWRDVQHLLVLTSQYHPLSDNPGWFSNAAKYMYNRKFGFGLISASELVNKARSWINVPPQQQCFSNATTNLPIRLHSDETVMVTVDTSDCLQNVSTAIQYLEHVQIVISLEAKIRGKISINVTSPAGTTVNLLPPRPADSSSQGLDYWPFTSVTTWGENPIGTWNIHISDTSNSSKLKRVGQVNDVKVILYGTKDKPHYAKVQKPNIVTDAEHLKPHIIIDHSGGHGEEKSARDHRYRSYYRQLIDSFMPGNKQRRLEQVQREAEERDQQQLYDLYSSWL